MLALLCAGLAALSFTPQVPLLRPTIPVRPRRTASISLDVSLGESAAALWSSYNVALVAHPLTTKAITAGVIIGAGDSAAQLVERRGTTFDVVRALRWAFFGLVLQGPWNHYFYQLLDGVLPPTPSPFTLRTLEKVGIDQFIQAPIFTIIILVFFAVVEGKGLEFAMNQIKTELPSILVKNWSVFLPATVINISFCPPELRVLFLNCVFFGWVIYLSLFLNQGSEVEEGR
eukprot:scaffold14058_cov117-Isochrysis_galbana.AAC.2